MPLGINTEKLIIDLIGEACVPEVTITEPIGDVHDGAIIRFHRTLVEETSIEKFSFENIGFVKANVIVEVYDNPNGIFSFSATPDTQTLLRTTDYEDDGKKFFVEFIFSIRNNIDVLIFLVSVQDNRCSTAVIRTMPQDVASFEVMFSPKNIGKYTGRIRLFIVDNPYDNLTIDLEGESFLESIILQDLEFLNMKTNNRRESNLKKNKLSSTYSLLTGI